MSTPLRELAARRVCTVRGQDPDELSKAGSMRPLWEHVAGVIVDPALRRDAREAIEWAEAQLNPPQPDAELQALFTACRALGPWMSAAIGDTHVCAEMRTAAENFINALHPYYGDDRHELPSPP
jgi:hypothetical protein